MAGIYIHIPFCKQKCTYCDFHFSTTFQAYRTDMIASMIAEIEHRKEYVTNDIINSIYFGGGTPSLLTKEELTAIFHSLKSNFVRSENCEITLEANPDDIAKESLQIWKEAGINRLSIGVQSFKKEDLEWMNRAHSVDEGLNCVSLAKEYGFQNLTVDLIYGLPNLSNAEWKNHLQTVINLGVTHISAYCLTVEEKTALSTLVEKGKIVPATEDQQSEQFKILVEELQAANFEQYEISNFCQPDCQAVHNTNYWKGITYLGIGPSAHSFNGVSRSWNIANNREYIKKIQQNEIHFETEVLSLSDRFNELLMTGLRTSFGVDLTQLQAIIALNEEFKNQIQQLESDELLIRKSDTIILTQKGRLQADRIASDLFIVE